MEENEFDKAYREFIFAVSKTFKIDKLLDWLVKILEGKKHGKNKNKR
jgi:hypothetical protein